MTVSTARIVVSLYERPATVPQLAHVVGTENVRAEPSAVYTAGHDEPAPMSPYSVVAAHNLFSPTRNELGTREPLGHRSAPPSPLPMLLLRGVVLDSTPKAFIENVTDKRTAGYRIGDALVDGIVRVITADHVEIIRGTAPPLILRLHDPANPRNLLATSTSLPLEPPPFRGPVPPGPLQR